MTSSRDLLLWIGDEIAKMEGGNIEHVVTLEESTDLHARFSAWAERVQAPWYVPDLMISMLLMNAEQSFGITVGDEEVDRTRTCGDLIALIQTQMTQA